MAKLQPDWLIDAMPLKIWLPARYDLPILGDLLQQTWVHYAFSWGGAIYDLTIPFLLLYKKNKNLRLHDGGHFSCAHKSAFSYWHVSIYYDSECLNIF